MRARSSQNFLHNCFALQKWWICMALVSLLKIAWHFCQKSLRNQVFPGGPHPSFILARRCLTYLSRWKQVCSSWYGPGQKSVCLCWCNFGFDFHTFILASKNHNNGFYMHSTRVAVAGCSLTDENIKLHTVTDMKVNFNSLLQLC